MHLKGGLAQPYSCPIVVRRSQVGLSETTYLFAKVRLRMVILPKPRIRGSFVHLECALASE